MANITRQRTEAATRFRRRRLERGPRRPYGEKACVRKLRPGDW